MNINDKYILKDKKAIPAKNILEWGKWFETADRIVKQELLPDGKWVSTVFLALDHGLGLRKPLLFETMVFLSKDNLKDLDVDRYSTWKEAEVGHRRMVKKWKNNKKKGKENT